MPVLIVRAFSKTPGVSCLNTGLFIMQRCVTPRRHCSHRLVQTYFVGISSTKIFSRTVDPPLDRQIRSKIIVVDPVSLFSKSLFKTKFAVLPPEVFSGCVDK